jgi:hypothetical protein
VKLRKSEVQGGYFKTADSSGGLVKFSQKIFKTLQSPIQSLGKREKRRRKRPLNIKATSNGIIDKYRKRRDISRQLPRDIVILYPTNRQDATSTTLQDLRGDNTPTLLYCTRLSRTHFSFFLVFIFPKRKRNAVCLSL